MKFFIPIFLCLFLGDLFAQEEVILLSRRVGTVIDKDENFYYNIFPRENDFSTAQVYQLSKNKFRVKIAKTISGEEKIVFRYISLRNFVMLQNKINGKEEMTPARLKEMYAGMDYLRAEKILNDIPKPQFISIKHSGKKILKGTLVNFKENVLHIQTPTTLEKIKLKRVDALSYRESIGDFESYRVPIFIATGLTGFAIAHLFNSNRSVIYNEYGIPRKDLSRFSQISGVAIGLIFSSELIDAVSTLLTPKETLILSKSEFERKNKN